jgi:D-alanyl-D-alanine carboxypeptidase/D-alanyl-D-alanine-endopeptidase (penicillin-binding protein 4)
MKIKVYCLLFFCLLAGEIQLAGQTQPAALNIFLRSKSVKHAAVSFEMVDLSTGKKIAAHNANMALTPASNMKMVTTATALELLGKNFYFETPLSYDGVIQNNILEGNLYIKGSGDPTLGSEFLEDDKEWFLRAWLAGIRRAGIKHISGNVIVLDQLYGYEGISPKWLVEDLGNYYAPGIYGISVFDNMYRVYLQSFNSGSVTSVLYTEPAMEDLQFTNTVTASLSNSDDAYISGTPFSNQRRLYGSIPVNRSSFAVKGDIPDPGLFLANYFRAYLQKNDIDVSGEATTYRLVPEEPKAQQELAVVRSPDLASIIRVVNVRSNNHYAEHLYKLLTIKDSIDIPAYWKAKGLDTPALFMYDGSGTSPANALSAGFLVQLLKYMDGKGKDFYYSLPLAGKEGTVASFLKGTSLEGKARIKSGSITNVQSYSGYIEKGNKRYAFSIIVNNFTGKRRDLKHEMEKLLVGLAD